MSNIEIIIILIVITIIILDLKKPKENIIVSGNSKAYANELNYIRYIQHECGEYTKSDVFDKSEWISFDEYCEKGDN